MADLSCGIPYIIQAGLISIALLTIALTAAGDTHPFSIFNSDPEAYTNQRA